MHLCQDGPEEPEHNIAVPVKNRRCAKLWYNPKYFPAVLRSVDDFSSVGGWKFMQHSTRGTGLIAMHPEPIKTLQFREFQLSMLFAAHCRRLHFREHALAGEVWCDSSTHKNANIVADSGQTNCCLPEKALTSFACTTSLR